MVSLGIFAKPPYPGLVKTRLIPEIGADSAALVYRYCLQHALNIANDSEIAHTVFLSEACDDALFRTVSCRMQQGVDLGARMLHAFEAMLSDDVEAAIIIGSDCLDLDSSHLTQAAEALIEHEIVLQPAVDGGYTLIGCRRAEPELFVQVEWSSERVLQQTLVNADRLNYRVCLLETVRDIDRLQDLDHYPELLSLITSS